VVMAVAGAGFAYLLAHSMRQQVAMSFEKVPA